MDGLRREIPFSLYTFTVKKKNNEEFKSLRDLETRETLRFVHNAGIPYKPEEYPLKSCTLQPKGLHVSIFYIK